MRADHEEHVARAVRWATADPAVSGLVLYGSVAQDRGHRLSGLDMVVVTAAGAPGRPWERRAEIAAEVLGAPIAWSHELEWQRPPTPHPRTAAPGCVL